MGEDAGRRNIGAALDGYGISYTYDNAGNRLTKYPTWSFGVIENYTYDAANKLLTAGGKSYSYDNAGNVVSVSTSAGTTYLVWDGASRLTGTLLPNKPPSHSTYNGLGQRVGKSDSTGASSYTLADDSIDSDVLGDGQASYQYGLRLVSEVRGGASRVYHADSLGTTRTMSDATGAASANLETDAFGNTISQTAALGTPFGFAGQQGYKTDADSGLMMLGYRYYDASVGRFPFRDPIQDGYNWYAYCDNNPSNGIDPEGLGVRSWLGRGWEALAKSKVGRYVDEWLNFKPHKGDPRKGAPRNLPLSDSTKRLSVGFSGREKAIFTL